MFAKIADRITRKLEENNTIDRGNFEICRYGLQQGFTIILNIISTLVIGAMFGMLWESILFTVLFAPLRSNAGGYHARTAARCYGYSILLMIAVLLTMKYLFIPNIICIIFYIISCAIILIFAPVEDANKKLDNIEFAVYKKRTIKIIAIETIAFVVTQLIKASHISICIMLVFLTMSVILVAGKSKNGLHRT